MRRSKSMCSGLMPESRGWGKGFQLGQEGLFAGQAYYGFFYGAVLKQDHGGDAADVEAGGEGGVLIYVDLGDADFAGLLAGDLVEDGSDHFARATPCGPEVDEDWDGALE